MRFCTEVQQGMAARNQSVPPEQRIEYRIGVNVGDVMADGDDLLGDGVNIAARIEAGPDSELGRAVAALNDALAR